VIERGDLRDGGGGPAHDFDEALALVVGLLCLKQQLREPRFTSEDDAPSSAYRISPRELGQFVMRAIGFRFGLKKYLDQQAIKRAERVIDRETLAVKGRVPSRRSLDYQALVHACRNQAQRDLEAKVDQLVRGGRWLDQRTRRSDYSASFVVMPLPDPLVFPMRQRQFFFIVERNAAGDGGRVVAVHEPGRFARLGRKKQPTRRISR
jgi:hypothetical protein